jgi:hypothetical protein
MKFLAAQYVVSRFAEREPRSGVARAQRIRRPLVRTFHDATIGVGQNAFRLRTSSVESEEV